MDLEFDDFDEFLSDEPEADDDALQNAVIALMDTDVVLRTAVLQKSDMVALLCIKSAENGAAICRVDPREMHPSVQIYQDPAAAQEWFTRSLSSSKRNGWNVVYDGLPLRG